MAFRLRVLLGAGLVLLAPVALAAQSLAGGAFRGAFVTMTKDARCPSTSTIAFVSQGEAHGDVPGMFDDQGSLTLAYDQDVPQLSIQSFTTTFTINKSAVSGEFVWEMRDSKALHITCDPLTLRIDGQVRYRVTWPFAEEGVAEIRILGTRRRVTSPYFGNIAVSFLAPR